MVHDYDLKQGREGTRSICCFNNIDSKRVIYIAYERLH